jgi:hypothetical protein
MCLYEVKTYAYMAACHSTAMAAGTGPGFWIVPLPIQSSRNGNPSSLMGALHA